MPSLLKSIANWFRGKKDVAADKLADPIRDGKFAIEDSEKRVQEFQTKVAKFLAVNKQVAREIDAQKKDIDKWAGIARKAAAAGSEPDVVQAVAARQRAEAILKEKQAQFDRNEQIIAQLRQQVQTALAKVAQARSNYAQLVARHEGAQVRKELAQAASDFGSSGPLAELDNLQKAVDAKETEAEAFEEMAQTSAGPKSLEDKYGAAASSASVNDEVARLMAEAKKK
jgi:phage shock protein A